MVVGVAIPLIVSRFLGGGGLRVLYRWIPFPMFRRLLGL